MHSIAFGKRQRLANEPPSRAGPPAGGGLPFAQRGQTPLRFQARYLVNDESGSVAWAPGGTPGAYGLLCFAPEQSPAQSVRMRAFLLPELLSSGNNEVGVEVEKRPGAVLHPRR